MATTATSALRVDRTALRVNQACIIGLLALAYLVNGPYLVLFVCLVMAVGTALPQAGLFKLLYAQVLRPTGLLRPDIAAEDPTPHLFAQGVGAAFLAASALLLLVLHLSLAGWVLAFIVIALAAVNLVTGFCVGCFMYLQLQRLGLLSRS